MTPGQWQKVKSLFDAALERDPHERSAFLDHACQGDAELRNEVESLLKAHTDAGSRYENPLVASDPMLGRQMGNYQILRRLGAGGMGAVYLASRADDQFRRLAAVKAIRPELLDERTRRRFDNERHTLAALEHPNIVKLLDGGTTSDGMPYLVMDYVEGQPIDRYCRDRSLSIPERLGLFRTLCGALHYAHQNLVVHRDLKPANILVTPAGVPKLLDFGIAKLLRPAYAAAAVGYTATVAQPMTPQYASPEQILGQPITTASDIYALGVLLYTLLAGMHPFERQTQSCYELERAICEGEAGKPSDAAPREWARQLRGDLDTIVQTAMRREPQKRYASAEHMAEDVRRYLDGAPVIARGESLFYRAGKFVRRHRLAMGAALVATSLLAGLAIRDDLDRRRAERRFRDLREFANFVIHNLDQAMQQQGTLPARRELVGRAVPYLDSLAQEAGSAELQLEVVDGYLQIGDIQGNPWMENVGDIASAGVSANKALEIAERVARANPGDARARAALSLCHEKLGDILGAGAARAEGLTHYQRALELGDNSPLVAIRIWSRMAYVQGEAYDPAAARESFRKAEQRAQEWLSQSPGDPTARGKLALAKERIAWFGTQAGEPSGAEDTIQEAIAIYRQLASQGVPGERRNVALAYKTLAEVRKQTGKKREALDAIRNSLDASEAMLADNPRDDQVITDISQETVLLIDLLLANGATAEASQRTQRAVAGLRPLAMAPKPKRYYLVNYVALRVNSPFAQPGGNDETLDFARKAVDLMQGEDPETLDLLAKAYDRSGHPQEAVAAEQKAVALLPAPTPGRPIDERRKALAATLRNLQSKAVK